MPKNIREFVIDKILPENLGRCIDEIISMGVTEFKATKYNQRYWKIEYRSISED